MRTSLRRALVIGGAGGYLFVCVLTLASVATAESPRPAADAADVIAGHASVIDGDTIEIHGTRVRLHGIDAPESAQRCVIREREVRCGQQAAFALAEATKFGYS